MFERFTDRARRVLTLAQEEARLLNHSYIGTEHILLGLIREGDGLGAEALRSLGMSLVAVREKVLEVIGQAGSAPSGSPPFTPRAKKVLELSLREALQRNHSYIGTEHILLGLVSEGEGVAASVLIDLGGSLARVRRAVDDLMTSGPEAHSTQSPDLESSHGRSGEPSSNPSCPGCSTDLSETARFRTMTVSPDDENVAPLPLHVVYCKHCGTTLHMCKADDPS